jgi:NTP pyrophosphatase (non-canonical NTP hydrolase)
MRYNKVKTKAGKVWHIYAHGKVMCGIKIKPGMNFDYGKENLPDCLKCICPLKDLECGGICVPVPQSDNKPLNYREIFAKGVRVKGIDSQIDGAIEEMAELTKALIKVKRLGYEKFSPESDDAKKRFEDVAEETADVSLALQQIIFMFGLTNVGEWQEKKMERYAQKLEEANDRP